MRFYLTLRPQLKFTKLVLTLRPYLRSVPPQFARTVVLNTKNLLVNPELSFEPLDISEIQRKRQKKHGNGLCSEFKGWGWQRTLFGSSSETEGVSCSAGKTSVVRRMTRSLFTAEIDRLNARNTLSWGLANRKYDCSEKSMPTNVCSRTSYKTQMNGEYSCAGLSTCCVVQSVWFQMNKYVSTVSLKQMLHPFLVIRTNFQCGEGTNANAEFQNPTWWGFVFFFFVCFLFFLFVFFFFTSLLIEQQKRIWHWHNFEDTVEWDHDSQISKFLSCAAPWIKDLSRNNVHIQQEDPLTALETDSTQQPSMPNKLSKIWKKNLKATGSVTL